MNTPSCTAVRRPRPAARIANVALVGAITLALCKADESSAFLIQTFDGPGGTVHQSWRMDVVPFTLDGTGSDDIDAEVTMEILRQSFRVWEEVPTASVRFEDTGLRNSGPSSSDRRNLIVFDESGRWLDAPPETGIIAVTRINSDSFSGAIEDADIIFNGRDWEFSTGTSPRTVNLKDVAVHEIGHLLGLEHSPLEGPPGSRPTMTPYYDGDAPGEAGSLEADDIAGVSIMYPTVEFLASSVTISGRIDDEVGDDVFGALLSAQNLETGEFISTLTGAFPRLGGRGHYFLRGLPAGSYRVLVAPVEGRISDQNFGGIFAEFDTDFPAEYYDNVDREVLAQAIVATPGSAIEGIDFTTGFAPPGFPRIRPFVEPVNTPDTRGPYVIQARVIDATTVTLAHRRDRGPIERIEMELIADHVLESMYEASIPGAPTGTIHEYRIEASTREGLTTIYPSDSGWLDFEILSLSGSPLAFAVYREEDVVGVIDSGTRREVARIPVGDNPIQMAVDPSGASLYVTNLVSDEIVVIETTTFAVREHIGVRGEPLDLAVAPDGDAIYVTHTGSSWITRIDVPTGETNLRRVPGLERGSYGVTVAGAENAVYLTDIGNDEVVVVEQFGGAADETPNAPIRIPVVDSPRSLASSPDGRTVYVTSFTTGEVAVIDAATNEVASTIDLPVSGTFAVTPNRDGSRVYFTAHDDGVLVVVDAATHTVVQVAPVGEDPRGVTLSPNGDHVYVTSAGSDEMHVVDGVSGKILTVYETGSGPRGVVLVAPSSVEIATDIAQAPRPSAFALPQPFPNPFNASTRIAFTLSDQAVGTPVHLAVYNTAGQRLRTLIEAERKPGSYLIDWDGRDDEGRLLASGVYLVKLHLPSVAEAVRKITLLR